MSVLFSGWGADAFTEQVEKATSELLPVGSEDIALNLDVCDQVRAKQVQPKQAMQVIKRRISHKNPNVVLLALGLTDICIKNGGDHFLQEVASREFMDNLVSVLKSPAGVNHDVKNKALGLIQNWAQIAEAKPAQMSYINDIYKQLKHDDRFEFPAPDPNAAATSAALVETLTAPEWIDGEVCMRCRTAFTTFNRKHHCRNCGNVFCQQCSSHTMSLAWFGIGQDVRVCDGCFAKKGPPKNAAKLSRSKSESSNKVVPAGRGASASQRSATTGGGSKSKRSANRQKEEDELALAIKLSLEASNTSGRPEGASAPSRPAPTHNPVRQSNGRMTEGTDAESDPDLAAAIAASLRDWTPPQPSAPDGLAESGAPTAAADPVRSDLPLPPSLDLSPHDIDHVLTFAQTVRAQQAHNQRHGLLHAPPDPQAQALYDKASSARPRIARNLDEGYRRHNVLVAMHDKVSEAVKLYDRLLDAQMARPAQQYSGYYQPNQAYGYGYNTAPSEYDGAAPSMYPSMPQGERSQPEQLHPAEQSQKYAYNDAGVYQYANAGPSQPEGQGMQGQMQRSLYSQPPQQAIYHQQTHQQPPYQEHAPSQEQQQLGAYQQDPSSAYVESQSAAYYPPAVESAQPAQATDSQEPVQYASAESANAGWSTVPIQAVAPSQQTVQSPPVQQQQSVKSDMARLPLFPIAPHADNGFGGGHEQNHTLSSSNSDYTNAPLSAEMWHTSKNEHSAPVQEAPLIEF